MIGWITIFFNARYRSKPRQPILKDQNDAFSELEIEIKNEEWTTSTTTAAIVFLFFSSFVRSSGVLYTLVNIERGDVSMACAGCHVRRLAEGASTSYIEKSDQGSGPHNF